MTKEINPKLQPAFLEYKWAVWALILIITLIWGYAWILMKEVLKHMGPFTFSAFRFGTGAVTLFIVLFFMRLKRPSKAQLKHMVIVGLLQTTIVFLLVMYGMQFVDAGKSSVLLYSMPIWSSFLAAKILKEDISTAKIAGLGLGVLGLVTILGWDLFIGQSIRALFGEALIIIAAISWGASNVYYRLKLQGIPNIQVTAYQMGFGTIGIILAAVVMEWGEPLHLNASSIFQILFTGVLASALCFTLWFVILSMIDMVTATLSTLLVPVFGLLFSSLLLDEKLTAGVMIGAGFILSGIVIAQLSKTKHTKVKNKSLSS